MPVDPEELQAHHCLVIRSSGGTLVDRWMFERGSEDSGQERRSVDVRTRLYCDDEAWLVQAARSGAGVLRIIDLAIGRYLQSGELVPVLQAWTCLEAPEPFAIYPGALRRSALLRTFLEFFVEALEQAARPQAGLRFSAPAPAWYGRARGRQSAFRG
jgi:LysR family transcriptional regulator for bpeEF and oprC